MDCTRDYHAKHESVLKWVGEGISQTAEEHHKAAVEVKKSFGIKARVPAAAPARPADGPESPDDGPPRD
jgi:hypothetical protein